jgi:hypothetical protein
VAKRNVKADGSEGALHDRPESNRARHKRWLALQKGKRAEAAKAARMAHRAELDAARVAKGLPPAKTATQRARECRERQAAFRNRILEDEWFSPAITPEEAVSYMNELHPAWSDKPHFAVDLVAGYVEWCRGADLNLNHFICRKGDLAKVLDQRALFHELIQTGKTIREAVEAADHCDYAPAGSTDNERRTTRYNDCEAARLKWGNGREIIKALLPDWKPKVVKVKPVEFSLASPVYLDPQWVDDWTKGTT